MNLPPTTRPRSGASTTSRLLRLHHPTDCVDARTIGYWKTHPHRDHLTEMLATGPSDLGDTVVNTANETVNVLKNSSATDARNALRVQLLATILNLRNGSDPNATGEDIGPTVEAAIEFLATHSGPVTGGHPDRDEEVELKDLLDEYNNTDSCDDGGDDECPDHSGKSFTWGGSHDDQCDDD